MNELFIQLRNSKSMYTSSSPLLFLQQFEINFLVVYELIKYDIMGERINRKGYVSKIEQLSTYRAHS